ncbi:twin-arginine translocation pathway signal protein [bacterium AH-315-P15]|nr:twin-arginine translocation pathway signal protein [bacterium AH-315-P15]
MNRRGFLRIAGSSAIIAAAGASGFALTRTPVAALAPWEKAGSADYTDARVRALSFAILAPNPHNRQPWVVDLATPGEATLYCDLDRLLPVTDPFNRQITIGLGCFLEILRMASAEEGLRAEITSFPNGSDMEHLDGRPIAHIRFVADQGVVRDPLFAHVVERRSNKQPYDTSRPVPGEALAAMRSAAGAGVSVGATNDLARVTAFREFTWEAMQIEMLTPYIMRESIDLLRFGKREINENPDGLAVGGPLYDTLSLIGLMSRGALADPNSIAFRQGLDIWEGLTMSAMGHIWVVTSGNTREDQMNAGRAWVRINLQAMEQGLGVHPLSQSLQEFPEMATLHDLIHRDLGVTRPATVQMFGRVGYGPKAPQTPRWPVETRLIGLS